MAILLRFLVITSLLVVNSCTLRTWHHERYTYVGGLETYLNSHSIPPTSRFYVGGAEIIPGQIATTHPHADDTATSMGPYMFFIQSSGLLQSHKSMTIENIQARSSMEREVEIGGKDNFPITILYEPNPQGIPLDTTYAAYRAGNLLNMDFDSEERLYVDFTVTIETNEVVDQSIVSIEFYPYLDKGVGIGTLADL